VILVHVHGTESARFIPAEHQDNQLSAGTTGQFIPARRAEILGHVLGTESARFISAQSAGIPDDSTYCAGLIPAKRAGI
jgi:hypothetical protein